MVLDMKTGCKRCDGFGMAQHKAVAGGVCFECGRLPAGESTNAVAVVSRRTRLILDFKTWLNRAAYEKNEGTLTEWFSDVREDIASKLSVSPADVADRARAAFAKLGLAV